MDKLKQLVNKRGILPFLIAVLVSLFHLYTGFFGILEQRLQRGIHLYIMLLLGVSVFRLHKKLRLVDYTLMLACIIMLCYTLVENVRISRRILFVDPILPLDIVFAVLTILIILEVARRSIGLALPIISIFFFLQALLGHLIPGRLGHRQVAFIDIIDGVYLDFLGIFGIPLGVSSNYAFLFVLFGAFLVQCRTGDFFLDIANSIAGWSRGGPAKVAIFSSALFGTISGNSVANVYSTGSFTIPMMIKLGYSPTFAGAVEAVASTGGLIMPPVMGAVAFVMAEMLGRPYIEIAVAAFFPAVLYFIALAYTVHLRAIRVGLSGIPKDQIPKIGKVLKEGAHQIIPIVVLVAALFYGYSPIRSVIYALIAVNLSSLLRKSSRITPVGFIEALYEGAVNAIMIAVACAAAGIIVGSLTMTGGAIKFVSSVVSLAGPIPWLVPILAMISCIVLGMGLPVTPAYIIVASLIIPAFNALGIIPLAGHLFVVYFAALGAITPPVAFAAYAAASIAQTSPMRVGVEAWKLAIPGFIIPFMFIYGPELLLIGSSSRILLSIASALLGILALASALEGHMITKASYWERILLASASIMLVKVGVLGDSIGIAILFFVVLVQIIRRKKDSRYIKEVTKNVTGVS
jgi:TRAP transporter 4TM/12TM fusion protein